MMAMSKSWSAITRYFVLALVLIIVIWLLFSLNPLLGPLAVSALLALVLNPAVQFVNKRARLSRHWVVVLVYLVALAVLVLLGILIIPILPAQLDRYSEQLQAVIVQVEKGLVAPVSFLGFSISLEDLEAIFPALSFSMPQADAILDFVRATTTNVAWILIVVVTTYYLLQDWPRLRDWMFGIVPVDYEDDVRRLYRQIRSVWQLYLQGQLRLMILIGVLTGFGTAAVGLQGAWLFGLLAGIFDVVLSVGPAIVMVIAGIVAFFTGSTFLPIPNFWFAILVLGIFGIIQMVENIWLRPRVMGQTLRLHPALVFIGVIGALALSGILMALIVVPLMGSAIVIARYLYCKILNIDPWAEQPIS